DLTKTKIFYHNESASQEANEVLNYTKNSLNDGIFDFEKIDNVDEGKDKVQIERSIFINVSNNDIEVYSSDKNTSQAAILITSMKSVNNSITVVKEMFKVNPKVAMEATSSYDDELNIPVEYLSKNKAPSSFDYYGVVEITMMILYVMVFALSELDGERKSNVKERICLVDNNRFKYYSSKIIASFILSVIILLPGFLFSLFVLDTNWGSNPLISLMYVFTFAFMTCTVGTMIGIIVKDFEKSMSLIQGLIIPVVSFLGGSYLAFGDDIKGIFQYITYLSPLRWLNRGLFKMIYSGDYNPLNYTLILNAIIVAIAFLVIYRVSRKEEIA
ncbi:MAG: ABC transporter permease, partial [Clostridium sp.]